MCSSSALVFLNGSGNRLNLDRGSATGLAIDPLCASLPCHMPSMREGQAASPALRVLFLLLAY